MFSVFDGYSDYGLVDRPAPWELAGQSTNLPTHSQNNNQKIESTKKYKGFVDYLKGESENTKKHNGLACFWLSKARKHKDI